MPNDYPDLLSVSLYVQYKGEPCPARHLQQDEHLHAGDREAGHQGGQGEPGGGEGFQVGHFENRNTTPGRPVLHVEGGDNALHAEPGVQDGGDNAPYAKPGIQEGGDNAPKEWRPNNRQPCAFDVVKA